jgi:phage terminase large subunit-like protein
MLPHERKAMFQRTVLENPWIRHKPFLKQAEFLALADVLEVMYGGAAGGGKSDALLMAALQFVEVPNYAAILFRRTFTELAQAEGLIDRAADWLAKTDAKWDGVNHKWTFPSGATLSFGHMDEANARERYRGSAFQFIGFDELTDFNEREYTFLFRCLRKPVDGMLSQVPLRMRSTTTPGGRGHAFVKKRFEIASGGPPPGSQRRWVKALLDDNSALDKKSYLESLKEMPELERRQHEKGDWSDFKGERFQPDDWPRFVDLKAEAWSVRRSAMQRHVWIRDQLIIITSADWASAGKRKSNSTAILTGGLCPDGTILLFDCLCEKLKLEDDVPALAKVCGTWHPHIVGCEADGFQAALANDCRRYKEIPEVRRLKTGGQGKLKRALPAILMGENGRIYLPEEAPWLDTFSTQLAAFTGVEKDEEDDIVDALAYLAIMAQQLRGAPAARREAEPCVLYEGRTL